MDLDPGYKQTELGVIPEDWETSALGSLTVMMTNGFVGTATRHYAKNDNGVLYIQGYNVEENSFNLHGIKYVTQDFHRSHSKSCLKFNDLLTVQTGDVGKTAIVPKALAGSNCHALIISRFDHKKIVPAFVSFYLNSRPGRSRLKLIETGTTMKHLNVGDLLHFEVPVPPTITEQQAIAEALSDADALIEGLEKLIAKKRLIKQGAMQELLTGKRRLPGFSGEWVVKRLVDFGNTYGGLTGKSKKDFGHGDAHYIPFMNVMANIVIDPHRMERVDVRPGERQNHARAGDLFFNGSSETPEEVGMCSVLLEDFEGLYLNSFCFGFRFKDHDSASGLYLAWFFRSESGRQLLASFAQGATRYNLSKRALLNLEFQCPPMREQIAIAGTLSDLDAEIVALEAQVDKAHQIKQGMMQELLTGRIRLV